MKKQKLKLLIRIIPFVLMIVLLSACSVSFQGKYPTDGTWYCEELNMYLDMETSTGYSFRTGEQEPLIFRVDYGNGIHISFCESEWSEEYETCEIINATFKYRDNILTLKDRATGDEYLFLEVH